MIGIWPEAWLRLHEREREVARIALTRPARVVGIVTATAPVVAAPVAGAPELACC